MIRVGSITSPRPVSGFAMVPYAALQQAGFLLS
jgi:hypothetical protein